MRSIRRSRSATGLLAIACLVAASACGADPPGQLVSPIPTDATDVADEPDATWAPAVDNAPEPASLVTSTAVAVSAPFGTIVEESQYIPVQWLVPWDDGFLALGIEYPGQPLPEQLPPEIAELFPPEVLALFPDGLPPTQQEAMDILNEAGLFDVVMDILDEHPEAMDALQSAPPPTPEMVGAWSTDGDQWVATEITAPSNLGAVSSVAVAHNRLTLAGAVPPTADGGPWTIAIASTSDLENWNTASLPVTEPEGLPEEGSIWVAPIAAAADDEHWVVRLMIDEIADPTTGVQYSEPRSELWSAAWDGEATMSDAVAESWMLLATSDGFLDLGSRIGFSPDGQTWTETPAPAPNLDFQAAAPLGDGALALTGTPYGESSILMLDATGNTVNEVEIPELGDGFSTWNSTSSPAFIVQTMPSSAYEQTVVAEHDGYELTWEFGAIAAYRLVEASTGDVVAEESVDLRITQVGADGPFEHLTDGPNGVAVTDPDTGVTIVEIPGWVMSRAWGNTRGGDETTVDPEQPDFWLLATADGETWLLHDLDESDPEEFNPPLLVAVNGTTVLSGTIGWEPGTDVWQRFTITE